MHELETKLCSLRLSNPTVLVAGVRGSSPTVLTAASQHGAGAVTCKSVLVEERLGHPNPTFVELENGFLNAIGLSCPPLEESAALVRDYLGEAPLLVNVAGFKTADFTQAIEVLDSTNPVMYELNISCPNVEHNIPFSKSPELTYELVHEVKKLTRAPVAVKLSPNVNDITEIAKAAVEAGANAISAINTVGPGMVIDVKARAPILSNRVGGLSGPAIKAVAVRCVYEIYEAIPKDIPIIGIGGVTTATDALEMIMAGATAVGVGSAVYYHGFDVFNQISAGLRTFLEEEGIGKIQELVGVAHE